MTGRLAGRGVDRNLFVESSAMVCEKSRWWSFTVLKPTSRHAAAAWIIQMKK